MRNLIAPTLRFSQSLYEDVLKGHVNSGVTWLDLGCGHQVLPAWRVEEEVALTKLCRCVVGIDVDLPSLQKHQNITFKVLGDITKLPFGDDSFELITANMVVEHLDNPDAQFREIHRVLKSGGKFILHTPNAHGHFALMRKLTPRVIRNRLVRILDGRNDEDVFEIQYKANTKKRIGELAAITGLEVLRMKLIVTDAVFSVVPPLAALELIWIRALMTEPLKPLRTNIIAILQKRNTLCRRESKRQDQVSAGNN